MLFLDAVHEKLAFEVVVLVQKDSRVQVFQSTRERLALQIHCLDLHPHRPRHRRLDFRERQARFPHLNAFLAAGRNAWVHEDSVAFPILAVERAQGVEHHQTEVHPTLGRREADAVVRRVHGAEKVVGQLAELRAELVHFFALFPEERVRVALDIKHFGLRVVVLRGFVEGTHGRETAGSRPLRSPCNLRLLGGNGGEHRACEAGPTAWTGACPHRPACARVR
mmetsp:Transcript_75935/g.210835  ORF Transcript_75935/g.210835 Transcript_75935/m.210835 type:complete len:223 (-) Transcript_75935:265-933(-)